MTLVEIEILTDNYAVLTVDGAMFRIDGPFARGIIDGYRKAVSTPGRRDGGILYLRGVVAGMRIGIYEKNLKLMTEAERRGT